jgi:hypothetical protein
MSNYGALFDGVHKPATKKALRELVASAPERVSFYDTSAFNNRGTVGVADLSPIDVIVGPDPYTKRSWYANVKSGKVV